MFDATTAQLLRSAPAVPGLNQEDIPALLTRHYTNLVSARLRGSSVGPSEFDELWPLERIADTYELIASIHTDRALRRASAFVAGTAQQILARRQFVSEVDDNFEANIDRNRVDPTIAAAVLFLVAEQYADANEAASAIRPSRTEQLYEAEILSENIADLARGRLTRILQRAERWRRPIENRDLEDRSLAALLEALICGVEILAANFLGVPPQASSSDRFNDARGAFRRVLDLSGEVDREHDEVFNGKLVNTFAGPHHLASLLIAAIDGMGDAALTTLPSPDGADPNFWERWLRFRANSFPYVWPNHRQAITREFHQTGKSAVVVLPTGAGKTTVSSLKIAGTLARREKVVFLAPTHALVEQLTGDLQEMFPKDILGSVVSSDFDRLLQSAAQLREIEVMTPERCLAMLSFAPETFLDVGLLVFDECHLLSPQSGKMRRALDGMLCLLGFNHIAPNADLLFLSAMLREAPEFAEWIGQLTGRPCVCVDLLWKPSRQARGVLIYKDEEMDKIKQEATAVQLKEDKKRGKVAKALRESTKRELVAQPWAIWGLQHNWLGQKGAHCIMNPVLDESVALSGVRKYGQIKITPNANQVAVRLAASAARNRLKSIVFVNTKNDAVSVARRISEELNEGVQATEGEERWWDALRTELGDLRHSVLPAPAVAVPHNSIMLRLERELAERMFKRDTGARVIVATPTLAQGLNLPAHIAILAGDKRANANQMGRESLKAHEILNAAARAGRAGHLANGVVVLIPEPIISFSQDQPLTSGVISKLKSILPEDDRCVAISDPLEIILDRLMQGESVDGDVRYLVNRMTTLPGENDVEEPGILFDLRKSLGAYAAHKRHTEAEFEAKIVSLRSAIEEGTQDGVDGTMAALASQSGLSTELLLRIKSRISEATGSLPVTVEDWLIWTVKWLSEDEIACTSLLSDVKRSVRGACGVKKSGEITAEELALILPGLLAWIRGKPFAAIEKELGGDPDANAPGAQICPRARELAGSVIPRGLSYVMGLVSHVVKATDPFATQGNLSLEVVECLGTAIRKGYDTPEKVIFAASNPSVLSRVQLHELWAEQVDAS